MAWPALLVALSVSALAEPLPRSALMLNQSDADSPWYRIFSSSFRSTLNAQPGPHVTIYAEHLDLSRFGSPRHDQLLLTHLRDKFRERPIGVVVAQGSAALEFALRTRQELWPKVPIVFGSVDETTLAHLRLPSDVTGITYELTFRDAVTSARMLVPGLRRIALVGDPFERQPVRGHFKREMPVFAAGLEIIDLMGLPMAELRKRVADLPPDAAIIYTAIYLDGAGVAYRPQEALAAVAEVANRPIAIDVETSLGYGGTGGLIVSAGPLGTATARLATRILDGEKASDIPVTGGDFTRPMFDWRQLQRFAISERSLPPGSDIRYREPSLWEQYRWEFSGVLAIVLIQAAMITWLLLERRRRRLAESDARRRLLEVAHLNRTAAAGALSASIAHELNQPLGAILSNAEAAELLLAARPPDLGQVKEILADIRHADQRAAEIIKHLRKLLQPQSEIDLQKFDLNETISDALHIASPQAQERGVALRANGIQRPLPVRADQIHLQQVILNLVANGMDAMNGAGAGAREMTIETALRGPSEVEVSVADSGTGIPNDKLEDVFDTFYTTKKEGTGLGLSIARTIVETYGGRIWAENRSAGGAVFRFTLPLAEGPA